MKTVNSVPPTALLDQLKTAEADYAAAVKEAQQAGKPGALAGRQSLLLDATTGRRLVQNALSNLRELEDGSTIEFQCQILKDAHFNFQLAKDHVKGLTAGYVGFDAGKILSYRPGKFVLFQVGEYDFAAGQTRFHVLLKIEKPSDQCRLTVRSLNDDKVLVENVPVALNGWNPVGNPANAISFDARTGSVAAIDEVVLRPPAADREPLVRFDFEPPGYPDGEDVLGVEGWTSSSFSEAPATCVVSSAVSNETLQAEFQKLALVRRAMELKTLPLRAAEAKLTAAQANLSSLEARIRSGRNPV